MPAPHISSFGDDDHEEGESNLQIAGFSFGFFTGEAWMYQNANRTGTTDQLTITSWTDLLISGIGIPAVPNNSTGPVFLFVQRSGDLAWSLSHAFTLSAAGAGPTGVWFYPMNVRRLRA